MILSKLWENKNKYMALKSKNSILFTGNIVLYASCQCIRIISHDLNIRIYFNYNLDFIYPEIKAKH